MPSRHARERHAMLEAHMAAASRFPELAEYVFARPRPTRRWPPEMLEHAATCPVCLEPMSTPRAVWPINPPT